MTWPSHDLTPQQTSRHQNTSLQSTKTSPPWNGRRLVHSKEMIWASRWSVALRTFYRQILSVLYSSFPFGNFRPRLVRALLVFIWNLAILCDLFGMFKWPFQWLSDLQRSGIKRSHWITWNKVFVCFFTCSADVFCWFLFGGVVFVFDPWWESKVRAWFFLCWKMAFWKGQFFPILETIMVGGFLLLHSGIN